MSDLFWGIAGFVGFLAIFVPFGLPVLILVLALPWQVYRMFFPAKPAWQELPPPARMSMPRMRVVVPRMKK